ncbi:hypothetical protein [Streptodolium elevatio]
MAGGVYTQGRTVREARRMAADALAAVLDVPLDTVRVDLAIEGTGAAIKQLRTARKAARKAAQDEGQALADAVAALLATGMSQRDVGDILDLSHQRISQLVPTAAKTGKAKTKPRKLQDA